MNVKKLADEFYNRFYSNHVILYIGQNACDDDIRELISQCPWSAVITSRKDPELATMFMDDKRSVYELTSREKIPAKQLSRIRLPIIRLFGIQGEEKEDLSWLDAGATVVGSADYDIHAARDILSLLPGMIDYINPLVVIGANSEFDWKVFSDGGLTRLLFEKTTDGLVTIWDMPENCPQQYVRQYDALKQVASRKKFGFYQISLAEIIKVHNEENDAYAEGYGEELEPETDIYYQGQVPVSISLNDLLVFKNVGSLLTDHTVNRIRPLGKSMSRRWFANFLDFSATDGPQWYGYLPQSTFYVRRSYEEVLVRLVRKMLEGKGVEGRPVPNRPIILSGDPGSSKSITLGALAYRIYQEKNNPVIYISADSYLSTNMGSGVEELDEAMQLLEQKAVGNVDTRILVVWDSSSYKMDVGRIRRILERLENRGRRFVMVCSSYAMYEADDKAVRNAYQFTENSERFEKCDSRVAQILDEYGCYIVRAVREMSDGEKDEFWEKVSEYSGIHEDEIERFKEKYKNENEIFNYYYYLLAVLRENLEEKLRTEQRIITPYVKRELSRMFGQIYNEEQSDKRSGAIYQALLRVGVDPRGISVDAEKEGMLSESDRTIEEKLDRFNTCVAMFSRFKLRIPYSLAYTFLTDSETVLPYSENGQKLYNIVTTSLPWIHYGVDAEGEFTFRFRNSLEADIYLENHDITGNQQVDLLCEIIDIYGEDYQRNRCKDPSFTKYLQSLLRFMGPNSTYVPFREERKPEYQQIEKRLDRVIEKLEALQNVYGVPDEDAGFAVIIVAFTREYYGGLWSKWYGTSGKDLEPWIDDPEHFSKESYERRIKKLISAITLAESSAERIQIRLNMEYRERQHLYNQNYSLIVEAAQCNLRLEELMDEYKRFCLANHMAEDLELGKRKLSYCVLYQKLQKIIASDPLNGYAYNTLFKAFERTYEKENLSEALRLQYLSEIMQVVESCRTMDSEITSRGNRDELSVHLAKITSISEKVPITLESIREYRESSDHSNKDKKKQAFLVLFDEMLEANNPAAIAFVCQKELKIPSGGRRELNEDEFSSCERVYKFMKEEEHFACICSSKYSLAMMIRVCWMCYNRTTLTSTPECQITRMDETAWAEINQLCRSYSAVAGDDRQPLLMLVYALSTLQISHRSKNGYEETMNILRSINEMSFTNGRMRTPFMLCDETGTPYAYTGRGVHTRNKMNGFIHINEVPSFIQDKNGGIRFHLRNLGWKKGMPDESQVLKDLELGIGYTGFSVYTAAGRREREVGE